MQLTFLMYLWKCFHLLSRNCDWKVCLLSSVLLSCFLHFIPSCLPLLYCLSSMPCNYSLYDTLLPPLHSPPFILILIFFANRCTCKCVFCKYFSTCKVHNSQSTRPFRYLINLRLTIFILYIAKRLTLELRQMILWQFYHLQ